MEQQRRGPGGRATRLTGVAAGLVALFAFVPSIEGHDLSRSESSVTVQGREAALRLRLNLIGLADFRWNRETIVSYDELEQNLDRMFALVKEHVRCDSSSGLVGVTLDRHELEEDHVLVMDLRYQFQQDVRDLAIGSTLDRVTAADHRHLTAVTFEGVVQQAVIDRSQPIVRFELTRSDRWRTAWSYFKLGATHIFTSADHLVFLMALVITVSAFRPLMIVLLSLSAADLVAVAVASFHLFVLPTRSIDAMLTLAILCLAAVNLMGARLLDRSVVAGLFGFVHSLGFANVLGDMPLPRVELALSLFSYNVGVELAQVAVLAALFPVVKWSAGLWRPLRPAVSVAVGVFGVYWLVQRSLLS